MSFPLALVGGCLLGSPALPAQELPHLEHRGAATQLIVGGQPFLILGGELHNSSAGTAEQADSILPKLARAHLNTVLVPVAWDQLEPTEGAFDFGILDHWVATARTAHLHLVLLWFGSWKNGTSGYAPAWVKRDHRRFPRAEGSDGRELEVLSTLSAVNVQADARAFRALMAHLKATDAVPQTVLMVQVENEVGVFGSTRDRSAEANRQFAAAVPAALLADLRQHPERLAPELRQAWTGKEGTWAECFGGGASAAEIFMAWNYGSYIGQVAAAGKAEYALPFYVNAQLPAPHERPGEYPSGGPQPSYLEVWHAAAPAIDFYSPDIYWPNFEQWCERYTENGNPLFIPEARPDAGPYNALYAFGEGRAFGFSPFGIDDLPDAALKPEEAAKNPQIGAYAVLSELSDLLPAAQAEGRTRALVLHASSPRASQTVSLGGYLFQATLARSYPANQVEQDDGAALILQQVPGEFLIAGSALQVSVSRDPDASGGTAGLASVESGTRVNGRWKTLSRMNGDEDNQGRTIFLWAHQFTLLRVRLY